MEEIDCAKRAQQSTRKALAGELGATADRSTKRVAGSQKNQLTRHTTADDADVVHALTCRKSGDVESAANARGGKLLRVAVWQ